MENSACKSYKFPNVQLSVNGTHWVYTEQSNIQVTKCNVLLQVHLDFDEHILKKVYRWYLSMWLEFLE
jgi:hypothetical protein